MKAIPAICSLLLIATHLPAKVSFPEINYNEKQLTHGKIIVQLLRNIKSHRTNTPLAKRLDKSLADRNSIFSPYKEWAQDLISLSRVKSADHFKFCKEILDKNYQDTLYRPLNEYCYLRFINLYGNIPDKSLKKIPENF